MTIKPFKGAFPAALLRLRPSFVRVISPSSHLVFPCVPTRSVKPQPPAAFEESTFQQLASAVDAVYAARSSDMSQEELYRAVESLCLHKNAEQLYAKLHAQCEAHIARALQPLSSQLHLDAAAFLSSVSSLWHAHCTQMLTLRAIFLYLDRTFIIHQQDVHSLWDMGLHLFGRHFMADSTPEHGRVEAKTRDGLLSLIERERQGETIPRSLVRSLLRMYSALHLYTQHFEPSFLQATKAFYAAEATSHLQTFALPDYLHHVEVRLHQENDRLSSYLDQSSTGLIPLVENALIREHTREMLDNGFQALLSERQSADLALMYGLFRRVEALDELKDAWAVYIRNTGAAIVASEEKEATMVTDLLAFKASLDELLAQSLSSNPSFLHALKASFDTFLNGRENKPAEMIAKHLDKLLRSGGAKGQTNEELDAEMERVMFLFRYIHSKDVFQAFYKKDLARRLLLNRSASVDAEKALIALLKAECGASFTTKLEGMFKDVELSKDIASDFAAHLRQLPNAPALEMSVQVLTMGSWPAYTEVEMALPPEVAVMQDEFKGFYLNKHSGRRLQWQNNLSTAILRAHFPRGKKELQVSGMQAIVLMAFNAAPTRPAEARPTDSDASMGVAGAASASSSTSSSSPPSSSGGLLSSSSSSTSPSSSSSAAASKPSSVKLSFGMLLDMTKLPSAELKRTLQSLCLSDQVRLLVKEPRSKQISESDSFSVDLSFRSPLFRIKVPSLQLKETKEEQRSVTSKVFEDRQYAIDAAIVRIMKARKTMTHGQLMAEVIAAFSTKFPVKPPDIKKRIATLIDREYMERDSSNSQSYSYLA